MKQGLDNAKRFIASLISHYKSGNISDSAAVLAFYTLLSIFPIIILLGSLLQLFHFDTDQILTYVAPVFPDSIYSFLKPIIESTISYSTGQFSTGLILTIWSASRAIAAFQRTINKTYGVAENQTAISNRVLSFVWMLVLIVIIILMLLFFTFGQLIVEWLTPRLKLPHFINSFVGTVKWPVTIGVLWLLLTVIYYFVPSAKVRLRYVWIGALVATIGLMVLSQGFSIYVKYFAQSVTAYKTIGTFIVLMFWLDISGLIMLFGGVVNATIQELRMGKIQEQADAIAQVMTRARKLTRNKKKSND